MSHQPSPIELQDAFFDRIKSIYKISKIYYPGCGKDRILNHYFGSGIVYLENNLNDFRRDLLTRASRYSLGYTHEFLIGDYGTNLIKPEVFDAVFLNDSDADRNEMVAILSTLKYGGIVINNDVGCKFNLNIEELLHEFPYLVRPTPTLYLYIKHKYFSRNYEVLEKIRK